MTISFSKSDTKAWSVVAATLLILASLLVVFLGRGAVHVQAAHANGERLVMIHDKNNQKVMVTKRQTVGAALKQAKITLQPYDNVDPSIDTKLSAHTYHINIYRAQPVLVVDGNTRQTVMTPYDTAAQIAANAKRPLYDEDTTTLNQPENILDTNGSGLQLIIDRATKFNLVLYGKPIEARTQAATVGEMIKDKNIKLKPEDTLSVPASTPISVDLKVEIWRNGKQTVNEEQPVAFPVQHIQDADQPIGYKAVKTAGILGKKNVTFEIEMRNGQELSRRVIQEVVTLQPQQQVEIIGAKPSFSGSFADALAKLRACEAGGSYTRNSGNGFYGAYQYDVSTWGGYGGFSYASDAPPAVQDQKVWETYQRRGWHPWPSCGANLPDTYR
jgi:uncharacterized protein YabE (DUF348 family)